MTIQLKVEDIHVGDYVPYGGHVTESLDGGAQIRLTFNTGADAYFTKGETLLVDTSSNSVPTKEEP